MYANHQPPPTTILLLPSKFFKTERDTVTQHRAFVCPLPLPPPSFNIRTYPLQPFQESSNSFRNSCHIFFHVHIPHKESVFFYPSYLFATFPFTPLHPTSYLRVLRSLWVTNIWKMGGGATARCWFSFFIFFFFLLSRLSFPPLMCTHTPDSWPFCSLLLFLFVVFFCVCHRDLLRYVVVIGYAKNTQPETGKKSKFLQFDYKSKRKKKERNLQTKKKKDRRRNKKGEKMISLTSFFALFLIQVLQFPWYTEVSVVTFGLYVTVFLLLSLQQHLFFFFFV